MKSLPYFPFYPGEWLRSPTILGMSLEEQGAYLRLLCVQWEDGFVDPEDVPLILGWDEERVARVMQTRPWRRAFTLGDDGMLRNERLSLELDQALQKTEAASAAAKARWEKHRSKGSPRVKRKDAEAEMMDAIHQLAQQGVVLPHSLQDAMRAYKEARKEGRRGVWRSSQWLANLSEEYSFAEWEEAYRTAARAGWASVHPKKAGAVKRKTGHAIDTMKEWLSDERSENY